MDAHLAGSEDCAAREAPSGRRARRLALLFVASLLLRLLIAWPVLRANVLPAWDEAGYLAQAEGFAAVLGSLLHGEAATADDLDRAYGRGRWPPIHPLVLGCFFLIFGPGVAVARLATVLLSAATTPLVYRLAERAGGRRAALPAACLHVLYPSFVGFSHLLWSETLFLLVLLATVLLFLRAPEAAAADRRLGRAMLAGALGGVAVLTRIAGGPLVVVLAAWLALRARGRERWAQPALALVAAALVVVPWQWTLWRREGSFHLLTTVNGYNLMLGQVPPRPGETGTERKVRVNRMIRARAQASGLPRDHAARELALEIIRREPGAFVARALGRVADLWYGEQHLRRHLYQAVYPPVSPGLAVAFWALLTAAFALLLGFIVWGLIGPGPPLAQRGLWLAMVGLGMVPSLPTVASPRMGLPLLTLLLPAAGLGLARLRESAVRERGKGWRVDRRLALLLAGLVLLQTWRAWRFQTSSALYAPIQARLGLPMRDEAEDLEEAAVDEGPGLPRIGDRLLLRGDALACAEIELEAVSEEMTLDDEQMALRWRPGEQATATLLLRGRLPDRPLRLRMACPAARLAVDLEPVYGPEWRRWRPAGLPGVEVMWLAGAEVRPSPAGFPALPVPGAARRPPPGPP